MTRHRNYNLMVMERLEKVWTLHVEQKKINIHGVHWYQWHVPSNSLNGCSWSSLDSRVLRGAFSLELGSRGTNRSHRYQRPLRLTRQPACVTTVYRCQHKNAGQRTNVGMDGSRSMIERSRQSLAWRLHASIRLQADVVYVDHTPV